MLLVCSCSFVFLFVISIAIPSCFPSCSVLVLGTSWCAFLGEGVVPVCHTLVSPIVFRCRRLVFLFCIVVDLRRLGPILFILVHSAIPVDVDVCFSVSVPVFCIDIFLFRCSFVVISFGLRSSFSLIRRRCEISLGVAFLPSASPSQFLWYVAFSFCFLLAFCILSS